MKVLKQAQMWGKDGKEEERTNPDGEVMRPEEGRQWGGCWRSPDKR